jgi:FkbM family methyltransferase
MNKYLKLNKYVDYVRGCVIKYRKSYSQSGEDLILNNFFRDKNVGVYVDIGANDPKKFNNTHFFYLKGWHGVNIEPNIKKIKLFKKTRKRDINLNLGVGQKEGELIFYNFKPDTLSNFSEEITDEYRKMGHKIKSIEKVKVLPLNTIFKKYLMNTKIDFMTVDTEGGDLEVLRGNDWTKYRPVYLIIETLEYKANDSAKKINKVFDDYLAEIGYVPVIDTYINTIYCDKKSKNI